MVTVGTAAPGAGAIDASTSMPGYCHILVPFSFRQDVDVNSLLGRLSSSLPLRLLLCAAAEASSSTFSAAACAAFLTSLSRQLQLIQLADYVCTNNSAFSSGSGASSFKGGLDWYKIRVRGGSELSFTKRFVENSFPPFL